MSISMMYTLSWCLLCFTHFFFTTLYMKVDTCNSMMQMMLSQGELTIFLGPFLPVKQYDLQEFQS